MTNNALGYQTGLIAWAAGIYGLVRLVRGLRLSRSNDG
jgi:hypothetical protein